MSIYMKLDGIKGNVTTQGYEGAIEIRHANLNFNRQVNTQVGNASNRLIGAATLNPFRLEKIADSSSARLLGRMLTGKVIPKAEIFMCSSEGDKGFAHVSYTLFNVIVKNIYTLMKDISTLPKEEIILDFTKIEISFSLSDALNKAAKKEVLAYDLATSMIV